MDRRVRPRPGDRRRPPSRSTCARRSPRRGVDLFALPEGSATVVCGDGAHDAARVADRRSRASRALHRSTSPTPTSRRAWRGACPGARSGSTELPHRARHPRRPAHPHARWRWSPAVTRWRHGVARRGGVPIGQRRRLGADDRDAARPRASPARPVVRCSDATDLGDRGAWSARDHAFDHRTPRVERVDGRALRTFAASSARRSATRSSRSGRRSNSATSAAVITPPWNPSVSSLRADRSAAYVGIGREQVALGRDVAADQRRDPRAEQRRRPARDRRRRGWRRAAASSRPSTSSSHPRSCTRPATWSSTSSGCDDRSRAAHCRQWSRIGRPPSSSASRRRPQRVEQRVDVGERRRCHNDASQRARGADGERDQRERRPVAGRRREHRRVGDHHVVDVPQPLPRVAHRRRGIGAHAGGAHPVLRHRFEVGSA